VLLVSHDLDLAAAICDRLLLLGRGRVASVGAPDEVLRRETLQAVFGCAVEVTTNPATGRPVVQVAWPDRREVIASRRVR
jgi:iron complex transport system ATP-binding protein